MRIAIVGPGAIGGLVGMRLALSGTPVTFIAHGATLAALRARGFDLVEADGASHHLADISVTDSMTEAGPHDAVLLTVKAQQVGPIAASLGPMIGTETIVVTMENGLPWWYFARGYGGELAGTRLESLDPGGLSATHLDAHRVIGAVEYTAARHVSATRIEAEAGSRIILGELDGVLSDRLASLTAVLRAAGFDAVTTTDIRGEIWRKLFINMSFNPVSALAQASVGDVCGLPSTRRLVIDMMREAEAVAQATGAAVEADPDGCLAAMDRYATHKTSMLQDVESGHPAEVEALVGAITELGRLAGVATPRSDSVHALMRLLEDRLEVSHGRLAIRP